MPREPRAPADYDEVPTSAEDWFPEASRADAMNARVAAGKAIPYLMKMEYVGHCGLEKGSVYGAAVAIPQIARSVGWSATFTGLAVRSYIFLAFNVFLQAFLISVMNEEAHIMNPFAGKMHLCDFGASIAGCPEGPNCRGPGGSHYSFPRLYGFDTWATRVFVRDALRALFPERIDDINTAADPGEYGLQDYYCRLVCCLIFMIAVMDDLQSTISMAWMLYHLPALAQPWIRYEVPDWIEKDHIKKIHGWIELDLVKFQVAGMPLGWKILNAFLLLLPKTYIWCMLVSSGFHFLMETAGIMDVVVNCMALTFVLRVDELVFDRLATKAAKHVMTNLEELALFDIATEEMETESEVLDRYSREEFGRHRSKIWKIALLVLPRRLLMVSFLMALFIWKYYQANCEQLEDGSWVSKPMVMPEKVSYNPLSFLHGLFLDEAVLPIWSMPPEQ